ncbi:MAG: ATP-binding protein [Saprospiraceae bacterium]|nr:ATP-binding protein [Saprospiraceae bacterium]
MQQLFSTDHRFYQKNILQLEAVPPGEPVMSGRIVLDPEVVEMLTLGKVNKPRFSTDFPAEYIQTGMEWDDLVLSTGTLRQIREIESWAPSPLFKDWGMDRRMKPGYRVLFHGPPGTGKTLTATLLGKSTNRDVFKIDLSMVVSKYIGETEKNLARLFDKAQNKDWILFL